MDLKLARVLQAFLLIILTSKATTTTINCSFDNLTIETGNINSSIQGYGCDIQSITSGKPQTPIKFSGIHIDGNTDNDVRVIRYQIYDEYQLPRFDSSFCEKFSNIETIFISQLEILSVDGDSLKNCKKLSKLYFYSNKIQELPENLLVENLNLTVLHLDFNYLHELPEGFLKNQAALQELSLTSNQFSSFASNFFDSLACLHVLELGSNKIARIDSKWFEKLDNLVSLGLERNELAEIPSNLFSSSRYLVELSLNYNKISTLTSNSFSGLKGLKSLNLDHNNIEELSDNMFWDIENLEELSIGHNKLPIIHSTSFGNLPNLTTLHLHFNEIEGFDERIIDNTALIDLDLTENLCNGSWILNRNRIKTNLALCFQNYLLMVYGSTYDGSNTSTTTDNEQTTIATPFELILPSTIPTTTESVNAADDSEEINTRKNSNCGKPKLGLQTTVGGTAAVKGAYPWNAVLFVKRKKPLEPNLICGGTIVSNRKVVTAAHCIIGKYESHEHTAAELLVTIGAHNLKNNFEIGRLTIAVKNITIHKNWNPNISSFDADIALLELDEEIAFSNHIQPICLMSPGSDMETLTTGIVAGFGKSEFKEVEDVARVIKMPIHSYENCVKKKSHEALLSHRMFCGGHANDTGVCVGDSGSGLYVSYKNTYYLRGIVSASLHGSLQGCNVKAYSVFTDAMKFKNFIETGKEY